jgi:hypothetical protein
MVMRMITERQFPPGLGAPMRSGSASIGTSVPVPPGGSWSVWVSGAPTPGAGAR